MPAGEAGYGGNREVAVRADIKRWRWLFRRRVTHTPGDPVDPPDEQHAAKALEFALEAAERAVQWGALTADATAIALTVLAAYDVPAEVDVTWTSVTGSYQPPGRVRPITGFRSVRRRKTNYMLLTALTRLMDRVGARELSLEQARNELERTESRFHPYRGWVIGLGEAITGAGMAAVLGGRVMEIALAGIACALLYVVQALLSRTQLSSFFIQAIGAAVPTSIAVLVMYARYHEVSLLYEVSPSLIVSAGIVSLLAGVGFVAAARDALDGNLLTSNARWLEAVIQTSGIVVGVVATLWLALALGVPGSITATGSYASPSLGLVIWAGLICIGIALGSQTATRDLPWVALLGATGYAVFMVTNAGFGNQAAAVGVGSFVVGFFAQVITGRRRIPLVALVTLGTVTMVPGQALFRGLFALLGGMADPPSFEASLNLVTALTVAIAIAAGSTFGSQLARPLGLPTASLFRGATIRSFGRTRRSLVGTEYSNDS
ncbi:MAG: threonine/serine exporter ThrE family protein [Arachnia sp.]